LRAGFTIVHDPTIIVLHYGRRQGRAVKDLLSGYSFGLGAFYTRNVRRGDWFAAYLLLQEFIWRAGQVTRAVLRRQRPPWLRYMAYMMLGAIAGLRHPTRLARPAPSAA